MIELYCNYLSVRCIWLYVIMSRMHFRVNPHLSCLNVKELLARNRHDICSLSDCNGSRARLQTKWLLVRVPLQSIKMVLFTFSLLQLSFTKINVFRLFFSFRQKCRWRFHSFIFNLVFFSVLRLRWKATPFWMSIIDIVLW